MAMRNYLILIFSLVLSVVGFTLPVEWLAMMVGNNGELFISVSSGSEDPFAIKLALGSFAMTFLFAGICLLQNKGLRYITTIYALNCVFYLLCMILVSLDSGILVAAKYGNWVPVSQGAFWLATVLVVIWVSFNKANQNDALSVA